MEAPTVFKNINVTYRGKTKLTLEVYEPLWIRKEVMEGTFTVAEPGGGGGGCGVGGGGKEATPCLLSNQNSHKKGWSPKNILAYISCFLPPSLSEFSGSATASVKRQSSSITGIYDGGIQQ